MFKELTELGKVTGSFMAYVYKYCLGKEYLDKINPDLYEKMVSAALRVSSATRPNIEAALKHHRTRFKIENNRWTHQVFNAPPLVVLNDAVSFLEVIDSVIVGNEYDIVAKEFFEALPIEYQKPEVLTEIRANLPKGNDFVSTNINYAVSQKPLSFPGFLRYTFAKDMGRAAREKELKIEVEKERYEHEKKLQHEAAMQHNSFIRQTMELKEWPEMSKEVIEWFKAKYPACKDFPIDDDSNHGALMARAHFALNKRKYGTFERYDDEGRLL